MRNSRNTPEIHAGSTADIAFLLLIFFLVSTQIPNDKGILRKLPRACNTPECIAQTKERNTLTIQLNEFGELFVNKEIQSLDQLEATLTHFTDNNGDGTCSYCNGEGDDLSSENPKKALINLEAHPQSNYKHYIHTQNTISKALIILREDYSNTKWNKAYNELTKEEKKEVMEAYPLQLAEGTIK